LEYLGILYDNFSGHLGLKLQRILQQKKIQKNTAKKEGIRGLDSIGYLLGFQNLRSQPQQKRKNKILSHLTEIRILELGNPTTAAKPDIKSSCAASKHHRHPTTPPKRHPCHMILGSD